MINRVRFARRFRRRRRRAPAAPYWRTFETIGTVVSGGFPVVRKRFVWITLAILIVREVFVGIYNHRINQQRTPKAYIDEFFKRKEVQEFFNCDVWIQKMKEAENCQIVDGEKEKINNGEKEKINNGEKEEKIDAEVEVEADADADEADDAGSGSATGVASCGAGLNYSHSQVGFFVSALPQLLAESEQLLRLLLCVGDDSLLLKMIDDGQAVDIKGISEKPLMKHLKELFVSLNLKEKGDRVFLLRSKARPTLEVIGPVIASVGETADQKAENTPEPDDDVGKVTDDMPSVSIGPTFEASVPRRRVVGPEMPSSEFLAAAAKLTEAQAEPREAELEHDNATFIGPPPPALVTEAESANEAERFEEVTRIMGAETDESYDTD